MHANPICFNIKAEVMYILSNAASRLYKHEGVNMHWFAAAVMLYDFFMERQLLPDVRACIRCGARLNEKNVSFNSKQCKSCIENYGAKNFDLSPDIGCNQSAIYKCLRCGRHHQQGYASCSLRKT